MISISTPLNLTTIPGITSAVASLSINNINLNGKSNSNVLLTCSAGFVEKDFSRYASVIYMSKLRLYHLSDSLICSSLPSKSSIIVNSSIDLLLQMFT